MAHFLIRRTGDGFGVHVRDGRELHQFMTTVCTVAEARELLTQLNDAGLTPEQAMEIAYEEAHREPPTCFSHDAIGCNRCGVTM